MKGKKIFMFSEYYNFMDHSSNDKMWSIMDYNTYVYYDLCDAIVSLEEEIKQTGSLKFRWKNL